MPCLTLDQREEAWTATRFPCIGRWKFLDLTDHRQALYQQIVFRLTLPSSRDCLLDLGCCVGQALRQLRADGVDGSRLFGIDLEPRLLAVGFSLFRDEDTLGATFVTGNMIDPEDSRVDALGGRVTLVHATSFFHLFSWTQQLYIGRRVVSFLKPGTRNALVYGRQVGTTEPRGVDIDTRAPYLHNQKSFQKLWDAVGRLTGTRWVVQTEEVEILMEVMAESDKNKDVISMSFTIYQIS